MASRVQRWGNSLAIRIPAPLAEGAGLAEGVDVELTIKNRRLVVALVRPRHRLADLLRRVNAKNLHAESWPAEPVGKEQW